MSSGDDEEDPGGVGTSSVNFSYGGVDDVELGQEEPSDGDETAPNAPASHRGTAQVLFNGSASVYKDEEVSFDQSSDVEEDLMQNIKSPAEKSSRMDSSSQRTDRNSTTGASTIDSERQSRQAGEERSSECEISVNASSENDEEEQGEGEEENGGHENAVNDLGDEKPNGSDEDDEVEFECNNWEIDELGVVDETHTISESVEPTAVAASDQQPQAAFVVDPLVERAFPDLVSKYRILARLGEGSYSSVYLGRAIEPLAGHEYIALKRLYPISAPSRIVNEISLLKELQGLNNVVPLLRVHRFEDNITLVLPYYESHHPREYIREMTVSHVRNYMRSLFTALQHVHAHKIIHRDVKPTNFLYSVETEQFTLLDFGLAQRQSELEAYNLEFLTMQEAAAAAAAAAATAQGSLQQTESEFNQRKRKSSEAFNSDQLESASKRRKVGEDSGSQESQLSSSFAARAPGAANNNTNTNNKESSSKRMPGTAGSAQGGGGRTAPLLSRRRPQAPRAGTRGFRPPEVLMRFPHQTVAVDIWSAGVTLLCILSQRYPFFQSPDDLTALCEIACVCGSEQLQFVATNVLQKTFHPPTFYRKCDWKELCEKLQKDAWDSKLCNVPDSAYDLLDRCLDPNPFTRITAEAALRHPFLAQTVALSRGVVSATQSTMGRVDKFVA